MAVSFHLSEASNLFLIRRIRVISGKSMASDSEWFAALSLGYTWRRWRRQQGTTEASAVTDVSVLQSYRNTQVSFEIPGRSLGCSLRCHSPMLDLALYDVLAGRGGYPQYQP